MATAFAEEILNAKKALRADVLRQRAALTEEKITQDSAVIIDKLLGLEAYKKSGTIMCFVDFKKEVRARLIINHALAAGKQVLVPIITKDDDGRKVMKASRLLSFEQDLESGTMGILEPKPACRRYVDPSEIDFFVVPGVAFDVNRNRLGYGGGFHDAFFKLIRKDCLKTAVCFDFQVFDQIPVMDYDVPVDMILTELRTIS
jgi:5-formyltetrahydrofolate cyclo-ligase